MFNSKMALGCLVLLLPGCMSEQEKVNEKAKDVRDAQHAVNEAEVRQVERVEEAVNKEATDAQKDVDAAKKDLEEEKKDLNKEIENATKP